MTNKSLEDRHITGHYAALGKPFRLRTKLTFPLEEGDLVVSYPVDASPDEWHDYKKHLRLVLPRSSERVTIGEQVRELGLSPSELDEFDKGGGTVGICGSEFIVGFPCSTYKLSSESIDDVRTYLETVIDVGRRRSELRTSATGD